MGAIPRAHLFDHLCRILFSSRFSNLIVLFNRKSSTVRDVPHLVPPSLVPQVDLYSPMGSHLLGSFRCVIMIGERSNAGQCIIKCQSEGEEVCCKFVLLGKFNKLRQLVQIDSHAKVQSPCRCRSVGPLPSCSVFVTSLCSNRETVRNGRAARENKLTGRTGCQPRRRFGPAPQRFCAEVA